MGFIVLLYGKSIEEAVYFNDQYYPDTSDFASETTSLQCDLELTEPKE